MTALPTRLRSTLARVRARTRQPHRNSRETATYDGGSLGVQTKITNSSATEFQLIYQAPKTNSPNPQSTQIPIQTLALKPPRTVVRVDSWASVVE